MTVTVSKARPKRMVGKCPVFALSGGEYMLTVHAMERAASRGMKIMDLLLALDMPDRVVHPSQVSRYHGQPVTRYVLGDWAVVVDHEPPVNVVVTVLFTTQEAWAAWNAEH